MQERILAPLGMMVTRTSFREAWNDARTIFQVERVEVGVELAPDTFTLQPFNASGR